MGRPAWIDEVFTLGWAGRTYTEIFNQNITPFMPATARTMFVLFRSEAVADELLVRLPHLLFGLGGVVAVFLFVRSRCGVFPAAAAALFLATLPKHAAYSQEARYYAFAILASAMLLAAVVMAAERPTPGRLAFLLLSSFLGLFNHLSFAFPLAALMVAGAAAAILGNGLSQGLRRGVLLVAVCLLGAGTALLPSLAVSEVGHLPRLMRLFHLSDGKASGPGEAAVSGTPSPPPAQAPAFRLSPETYWTGYLARHYTGFNSRPFFFSFLMLAAVGLFRLLRNDRSLALALLLVALTPLPFFFVPVGHTWSPRYFVAQTVLTSVLAGVGTAELAKLAGRAVGTGTVRRGAAACLVFFGYALFLHAGRAQGFADMHGSNSDLGQREISRAIAARALCGDSIVIVGGQWGWRPMRVLRYYLEHDLAHDPAAWFGLVWAECASPADLPRILRDRGEGNIWVVLRDGLPDGVSFLSGSGAERVLSPHPSSLWLYGRETVNLLGSGDFEVPLDQLEIPEGATLVSGTAAGRPGQCLRVDVSPDTDTEKRPMPTVWFTPVRDVEGNPAVCLPADEGVLSFSFLLKCDTVVPGKFPSRVVRLVAAGKDHVGEPFFTDILRISGTRDWQRYEVQLVPGGNIPADVREFKVGIGNRGGSGTFWLDDVQLEAAARATPFTRDVRKRQTTLFTASPQAGGP